MKTTSESLLGILAVIFIGGIASALAKNAPAILVVLLVILIAVAFVIYHPHPGWKRLALVTAPIAAALTYFWLIGDVVDARLY